MDYEFEIEHFQTLDSTSSYLQRSLQSRSGSLDPGIWHVCSADFQTAGRGQRGNSWTSGAGENLLFSILFHPCEIPASGQFVLTEIFSLAMVDFFSQQGVEVLIKWPNDIYAGSRKICGMLFENSLSDGLVSTSIVGIGVNLNQTDFGTSIANPTSLAIETGKTADRNQSLSELLVMLRARYENFANGAVSREALHAEYLSKLFRYGEFHKFQKLAAGPDPLNVSYANSTFENVFEARISNVKENGLLVLENREGREIEFAFKEVKFLL